MTYVSIARPEERKKKKERIAFHRMLKAARNKLEADTPVLFQNTCTYITCSGDCHSCILISKSDNLELFIFITYFFTFVPLTSCVLFPVGLSLLTDRRQKKLQGLLKNVALRTKGLQEIKHNL